MFDKSLVPEATKKSKENGKELKVIADLQTLWQDKYGDSYPQAAIFVLGSTYENDPASVDSLINTVKTFIDNTNADKAEHKLPPIYVFLADTYSIRQISLMGKLF